MSDLVQYSHRGPAAVIALNRPDKRNALSRALIAALADAFRRAADDPAARCVILTGNGPAFCAGMDLDELRGTLGADSGKVWDDATKLSALYDFIYSLPKPTIAAVNGTAVAGGAGLVAVCDLAVSVPEAKFGYPEVRRGLVAAMVMPHLLRHVGERTARYLLLTGELIDAVEALRLRLINAVVSPEHLLDAADSWAKIAGRGRTAGAREDKGIAANFLAPVDVGGGTREGERRTAPDGGSPRRHRRVLREETRAVERGQEVIRRLRR